MVVSDTTSPWLTTKNFSSLQVVRALLIWVQTRFAVLKAVKMKTHSKTLRWKGYSISSKNWYPLKLWRVPCGGFSLRREYRQTRLGGMIKTDLREFEVSCEGSLYKNTLREPLLLSVTEPLGP